MQLESSVSFYPVSNIQNTYNFYSEILGLTLYQDMGNAKLFDTGYGYWGFVEYSNKTPNPIGLCLSLNCKSNQDVDLYYQELLKKGVQDLTEPKMHPDFPVYSFFFKDPDGYLLELQKIQTL